MLVSFSRSRFGVKRNRNQECHSQKRSRRRERGQGMTEYIIIVALVAVAAIAVYQSFGRVIRSQTAAIANELAGESSRNAISSAGKAAGEANKQLGNKSLKSYGASSR